MFEKISDLTSDSRGDWLLNMKPELNNEVSMLFTNIKSEMHNGIYKSTNQSSSFFYTRRLPKYLQTSI